MSILMAFPVISFSLIHQRAASFLSRAHHQQNPCSHDSALAAPATRPFRLAHLERVAPTNILSRVDSAAPSTLPVAAAPPLFYSQRAPASPPILIVHTSVHMHPHTALEAAHALAHANSRRAPSVRLRAVTGSTRTRPASVSHTIPASPLRYAPRFAQNPVSGR
ncbi:hypothetical protein C8R43DRAFT_1153868 [Mycena crocata]|nr:hypothetical protein C8R43DRAFT_1153868 [Mycena crocata]